MSATEPNRPNDIYPDDAAKADPYAVVHNQRNGAGTASLIVATVIVVLGLVRQVVLVFIPQVLNDFALSISVLDVGLAVWAVVESVLAVTALILGLLGLTRPGLPRGAAGAGTAIAIAALLGVIVGFIVPLIAYGL